MSLSIRGIQSRRRKRKISKSFRKFAIFGKIDGTLRVKIEGNVERKPSVGRREYDVEEVGKILRMPRKQNYRGTSAASP